MTKKFEFNWHISVPEPLLKGCIFDRWSEEKDSSDYEQSCMFKVDEYGFFIYWKSEQRVSAAGFSVTILLEQDLTSVLFGFPQDGDVIELCQVSDVRAGGLPKVSRELC